MNIRTMKYIKYANKKKPNEKTRMCFDCDNEYTPKKSDLPWLYCPYCGKKTFGFDDESYSRFEEVERLKKEKER